VGTLDITDEALLRRVAEGDGTAFADLYRRHLNVVLAYVRRRISQPELVFDITAETFAAVALDAASYRGGAPVIGWICGIARNQLGTALRKQRVEDDARRRLGLEPVVLSDADIERVEERVTAGAAGLEAALAGLPELHRQALLARVVDERDYREIATELQCSEQVVRQRVHRGLSALRAAMGDRR
jgi:RNA polymerase sigma-70 factor (ECF subfamily)